MPKRDKVTGEWRRLYNKELSAQHSLPNIIQAMKSSRMRWAGHVAYIGMGRGSYRVLVGKPEGRRPLGESRYRWDSIIKMDLQKVGWERGLDCSGSGKGQVAASSEYCNEPSGSIKHREFLD